LPGVREKTISRKDQILRAAQNFFYTLGYEKTSIQDIIDEVGIAKGTFYHYFRSKTDLLDSVVTMMFSEAMSRIVPELQDGTERASSKFRKLFRSIAMWKIRNRDLFRELIPLLYRDDNIVLRHKMMTHSVAILIPVLEKIISQGIREGEFHVENPYDSAVVLLNLSSSMGESMGITIAERLDDPDLAKDIARQVHVSERAIERILGADEGTLKIFQPELIDQFI